MDLIAYRIHTEHRAEMRVLHSRAALAWARSIEAVHKAEQVAEDRPGRKTRDALRETRRKHRLAFEALQLASSRLAAAEEDVAGASQQTALYGEEEVSFG